MKVTVLPVGHDILNGVMELSEGEPRWDVKCTPDKWIRGAKEGQVHCVCFSVRVVLQRHEMEAPGVLTFRSIAYGSATSIKRYISLRMKDTCLPLFDTPDCNRE